MGDRTERTATADTDTEDVATLRGPLGPDTAPQVRLVHDVLNALDGMLDAPIEERVAVVALHAAHCLQAAAWRIGRVDAEMVRSHRREVIRPPAFEGAPPLETVNAAYPLASRPSVAAAAEGSAFSVTLTTGDVVERDVLTDNGFVSAVVAGGYDPDACRWFLELFGDEFTHETESFAAILFALVQAALGFPRAVAVRPATG